MAILIKCDRYLGTACEINFDTTFNFFFVEMYCTENIASLVIEILFDFAIKSIQYP